MDQPPTDNTSEFLAHSQLLIDKDGEKLVTIVKATFELPPDGGPLELAPEWSRRVVRKVDVPWGEPEKSSIMFPCDLCLRKPGTDVVIVARGCAPNGEPAATFDVAARVGKLQKLLAVFGLRVWQAGGAGLTPPRPIQEIDLRFDYAWGGLDKSDPTRIVEEPRNPVGMGVARDLAALTHQPAPSIEDPRDLILTARTRPPPAGVGPIGRHWEPRRKYVGTYDNAWLESRAPLPPVDQDDRMNSCATPDLHSSTPLVGGEEVALLNMTRGGGAKRFHLPVTGVDIFFEVKGREPETLRPSLDTVIIDAYETQPGEPIAVELVWRAYVKAPRRMKDVRIRVSERGAAL